MGRCGAKGAVLLETRRDVTWGHLSARARLYMHPLSLPVVLCRIVSLQVIQGKGAVPDAGRFDAATAERARQQVRTNGRTNERSRVLASLLTLI